MDYWYNFCKIVLVYFAGLGLISGVASVLLFHSCLGKERRIDFSAAPYWTASYRAALHLHSLESSLVTTESYLNISF